MTEPTQGETLRERVADALWRAEGLATDWKITGSWADLDVEDQDYWLFQADAVIPLVTEDVQRRIQAYREDIHHRGDAR